MSKKMNPNHKLLQSLIIMNWYSSLDTRICARVAHFCRGFQNEQSTVPDAHINSMRTSGSQFTCFDLVHITPDPGFSRLDGAHERMLGLMKMLCGMLILGRVAARSMPADEAHPQMDPSVADLYAVLTYVLIGLPYFDLVKVSAFLGH
jgi:hypothetical protein